MYKPPSNELWKGRMDHPGSESDLRWHQVIHLCDLQSAGLPKLKGHQKGVVLLGFLCDEGVRRNHGRIGAYEGSNAIRRACGNFAWHFDKTSVILADVGNVECRAGKLEEAQDELASVVSKVLKEGYFPVIMGGGHEVSFGGYKGVFDSQTGSKSCVGIINFDAHFDLRDFSEGANSGTSFAQIANLCTSGAIGFNYLCLGIQPHANTKSLFNKAENLNVSFVPGDELIQNEVQQINILIRNFIKESNGVYLTIDMDVFNMTDAPGVSAPSISGVDKRAVFQLLKTIFATGKVIACDIAEMNPKYDPDQRTTKLAAYLVYQTLDAIIARTMA